jgi:hypothetical protein
MKIFQYTRMEEQKNTVAESILYYDCYTGLLPMANKTQPTKKSQPPFTKYCLHEGHGRDFCSITKT